MNRHSLKTVNKKANFAAVIQEAQLSLRKQGVSLVRLSHRNATLGHLASLSLVYVACGIFSKNTWQRTHASLQE